MARKGNIPTKNKSGITISKHIEEEKKIKTISCDEEQELMLKKPYKCVTCGKRYSTQKNNFSYSQSPLYNGNNHFLPTCITCLESLVEQYTVMLGSQDEAIKRVCLHYDIFVSESTLNSCKKIDANRSRIREYIRQCNLQQNAGKTYDTYLSELNNKNTLDSSNDIEKARNSGELKVAKKTISFFGLGYTPEQYRFLQDQYDDWTHRHECRTKSQEEVFKNLCIAQLNIQIAQQTGGKVKDAMDSFQNLLGTANLKPCQTNENALADQNTFGTLIKKWENEKPISEPDPEWKDVDGIARYIHIYFLGHLCKMMGIKNSYSRMYDEEMEKYRVEKPEYEGDDEALFDAVFSSKSNKDDDDNGK